MACRAAGIDFDGPFADFRDPEAYKEECSRSLTLGCVGKWAIHPTQIDWALDVFTPDAGEVARALARRRLQGSGSAGARRHPGRWHHLVDVASIRMFGAMLRPT